MSKLSELEARLAALHAKTEAGFADRAAALKSELADQITARVNGEGPMRAPGHRGHDHDDAADTADDTLTEDGN